MFYDGRPTTLDRAHDGQAERRQHKKIRAPWQGPNFGRVGVPQQQRPIQRGFGSAQIGPICTSRFRFFSPFLLQRRLWYTLKSLSCAVERSEG